MGLDIFFTKKSNKEIGYFRKVNFLVKFFEDRGFDTPNQTPLKITRKDAEELLARCDKVISNHSLAKTLLPTMDGFFFGDITYDEYYFAKVQEVRDYIKYTLLTEFDSLKSDEDIYFETWY